jgi:hypothetical protein
MIVPLTHLAEGETAKIIQVKEVAVTNLTGLTIKIISDNPSARKHQVYIDGFRDPIVLWEGNDYDLMNGSFTHADVVNRIQLLATNNQLDLTIDSGK